jgi:hypothetical protein
MLWGSTKDWDSSLRIQALCSGRGLPGTRTLLPPPSAGNLLLTRDGAADVHDVAVALDLHQLLDHDAAALAHLARASQGRSGAVMR